MPSRAKSAPVFLDPVPGSDVSFGRHGEIYRSDVRVQPGWEQHPGCPPPAFIGLDEFPVGYSLAGCSPAEPTSASPTASDFAANAQRRRAQVAPGVNVLPHRGWMPKKKSAGRRPGGSVFCLTSPLIEPAVRPAPFLKHALVSPQMRFLRTRDCGRQGRGSRCSMVHRAHGLLQLEAAHQLLKVQSQGR